MICFLTMNTYFFEHSLFKTFDISVNRRYVIFEYLEALDSKYSNNTRHA